MIYIYYLEKEDKPFYIGYTRNLKERTQHHKNKLGKDINLFEIDNTSEEYKKELETFYIELFKQWGFNLVNKNKGGGGCIFHSNETKIKMSKSATERKREPYGPQSEDTILRKKSALTGKPKPIGFGDMMRKVRIGVSKPPGTGDKIRLSLIGKTKPKKYKAVLQYNLEGNFIKEWDSINLAAEGTKSNASSISKTCRGVFKQTNRFIWKFKNGK